MAINGSDLGSQIAGAMNQADNPTEAHNNFSAKLQSYINENCEILGTYVGVLPTVPPSPDPLSGPYQWKAQAVISGSALKSGATGGFSSWTISLAVQLSNTTFQGSDKTNTVTAAPTKLTIATVSIDMSGKPNNMNDAMAQVGAGIVNALKSGIPTPPVSAATSTAGGTGTVSWGAVG